MKRERGSARKEENRGGRETERATGEKKKLGQVRQVTAAARDSSAAAACSLIRQEQKKKNAIYFSSVAF